MFDAETEMRIFRSRLKHRIQNEDFKKEYLNKIIVDFINDEDENFFIDAVKFYADVNKELKIEGGFDV